MLELEAMDPNVERFTKVERQTTELFHCYRRKDKEANYTDGILHESSTQDTDL